MPVCASAYCFGKKKEKLRGHTESPFEVLRRITRQLLIPRGDVDHRVNRDRAFK